ncbi:MAG: hypothetical protein JXN64_06195 [Spirochaetes bacterium]|nr:hypothetical protein [Spirochaetota bacterium]
MKKYLIIAGLIIYALICGIIGYKLAPDSGTVNVGQPTTTHTWHTDKPKNPVPLQIKGELKDSKLGVDCWDNEKSIHADFPISCIPRVRRHIIQVSYLFQYHDKSFLSSYGVGYLYNFGRFAIGGNALFSNKSAGLQASAQINF